MAYQPTHFIPTDAIDHTFESHLALSPNKRILFSAPFGAGKSLFLHRLFSKEERVSVSIHPLDYAVSSNEDIFELIKFDILRALIEKYEAELDLDPEGISDLLMTQEFIRNRMEFYPLAKEIAALLLPGGSELKQVMELIEKQLNKYPAFKEEIASGEERFAMEYMVLHKS